MSDPNLWNIITWLSEALIGLVFWWLKTENSELKRELEKVRDYTSTRFHEINNKTLGVLADFVHRDEIESRLKGMQDRLDQLRDRMNGKH